jgi:hypothetical protein
LLLHAYHPFLAGEAVGDVIADGAGAALLHRLAALLRGGVGIPACMLPCTWLPA